MKPATLCVLIGFATLPFVSGCENIGTAQAGASPDQVKKEIESQPPKQQIRNLMYAPLPPAEKEKQIKALEEKYHVTREDAMAEIKDAPPPKFSNEKPPEIPTGK